MLVNNAGWTTRIDHRDLDAVTDEIFRKTFEVNVFGTWNLTKAAMPHLKQSDDGNVVTITSVAGRAARRARRSRTRCRRPPSTT